VATGLYVEYLNISVLKRFQTKGWCDDVIPVKKDKEENLWIFVEIEIDC